MHCQALLECTGMTCMGCQLRFMDASEHTVQRSAVE